MERDHVFTFDVAAEVYDAVMAELRRQVGDAGPTPTPR